MRGGIHNLGAKKGQECPCFAPGGSLRELRAVAVLERVGTSEAVGLLRELARGDVAVRLTREAKASLERLSRRHSLKP